MTGAFGGRSAALVVDLRGRDVPVAEQVFHLNDVHAGVKQQRGRGRAEGVRRVQATPNGRAIGELFFFRRAVLLSKRRGAAPGSAELTHTWQRIPKNRLASCWLRGPRRGRKRGPLFSSAFGDVLGDGLRGSEVQADGAALVALLM